LVATIIIAIVNTLIGWPLQILTLPFTILTLGLFWLVLNAILLKLSSMLSPGFKIDGFLPAMLGSIALTVLSFIMTHLFFPHAGIF
jgi:putative membrane protein